jgi:type IV pilus assembly protein PilB
MAYFVLRGSVGVGYVKDDDYVILNILKEGDYFGEMAALSGSMRNANVITEEDSEFLVFPSHVLRELARKYADARIMFQTTMKERLSMIDTPRRGSLDQQMLRQLRTSTSAVEKE